MTKTLKKIVDGLNYQINDDVFLSTTVEDISCDSRTVGKGSMFIAQRGACLNGEEFIEQAIQQGAVVIVTDNDNVTVPSSIALIIVDDTKAFMYQAAARFFGYPSEKLHTTGITGTNGKTTVTYLLESILNAADQSSAVMGTINARVANETFQTANTTPGNCEIQRFMAALVEQRTENFILEVSSHGLEQGRVTNVQFDQAVFTNLSSEHLDYHKTMDAYFKAKSKIFDHLKDKGVAIINADDAYGRKLIDQLNIMIMTFGIEKQADVKALDVKNEISKTTFTCVTPLDTFEIKSSLIGKHNVSNLLAAIAAATAKGVDTQSIVNGIANCRQIPGRLESVKTPDNAAVLIDYAHTPDALLNVLQCLKPLVRGSLKVVFGCGGNRDQSKRPLMATIASQYADFSYITSDNPREESPKDIVDQIVEGFENENYEVILDRREAIHKALKEAKDKDVILLAGKGHENYMIIKNEKMPFDEREIINKYYEH